jgi:O-antigen/teichoic acid export membrane protein
LIKNYFNSSEIQKNLLVLIWGTALAQMIPILLQPILRRIYEPSDFGLFAIYTTLYGMLVALANLKYESSIVLPKEDAEASNLLVAGILTSFIFSLSLIILVYFSNDFLMNLFSFPIELKKWLYLIPLSVFLLSSYQCINYWFIRKKAFKTSSLNKLVRRGSEGLVQVSAVSAFKSVGLIWGSIVGDFTNFFTGIWQLRRIHFPFKSVSWKSMKAAMLSYKDFPLYHAFPSFLNAISLTLPVLILNKSYGEEITGQFDLSRMILALPLALVSVSLSQVLLQQFAEFIHLRKSLQKLFFKTFKLLILIAIPGVIIALFFSVSIFVFIFGDSWRMAGGMTQILIISYAMKFIVSPLTVSFIALKKVRWSATWQVLYFGVMVSLFFVKIPQVNDLLLLYVAIDIVFYLLYFLLSWRIVFNYEKSIPL